MAVSKVLIVAGGTGGHIFPALAFGEWLMARQKAEQVIWLSGSRPLEIEIYRSRNVEPRRLSPAGSPLGSTSPSAILHRCLGLLRAFFQTRKIFREERPDICFLFGGYVSLMPLLWSRILRVPAVMHEQNAHAGRVTRLASRLGVPVASGWRECHGLSKPYTTVGIPVRPLKKIDRRDAARMLDVRVDDGDLVIGVIGGSLSSASLNALPRKMARESDTEGRRRIFVILGDNPGTRVVPSIRFVGRQWDTTPFYSLVDGVVCRAGASTLAELAAYDVPALTVPWLQAADGHQEANARCFAETTSNPVWREDGENDPTELFAKLLALCEKNEKKRESESPETVMENEASSALWDVGNDCLR